MPGPSRAASTSEDMDPPACGHLDHLWLAMRLREAEQSEHSLLTQQSSVEQLPPVGSSVTTPDVGEAQLADVARVWQECQNGRSAGRRACTSITSLYSSGDSYSSLQGLRIISGTFRVESRLLYINFFHLKKECDKRSRRDFWHVSAVFTSIHDPGSRTSQACAGAMEALLEDIRSQRAAADLQLAAARYARPWAPALMQ